MLDFEKGKKLAQEYPEIFGNDFQMASEYLQLVANLKAIDKEFNTQAVHEKGQRLSKQLMDFLNTKIQFKSIHNLFKTMEDIVAYTKICSVQKNKNLQKYGTQAYEAARNLLYFALDKQFTYVNVEALAELNLKELEALEKTGKKGPNKKSAQ